MFSNAKNVEINGKTVKSIILENGGVLYEKLDNTNLELTYSPSTVYNSDTVNLTATLTDGNISNKEISLLASEPCFDKYFPPQGLSVGEEFCIKQYQGDIVWAENKRAIFADRLMVRDTGGVQYTSITYPVYIKKIDSSPTYEFYHSPNGQKTLLLTDTITNEEFMLNNSILAQSNYTNITTNSNGVASTNIICDNFSSLNITASYNNLSNNISIIVNDKYDLDLVSDKNILSSYDNDTATLTATLTKNNSALPNEQVLFYDSDKVSLATYYDWLDVFLFTVTSENQGEIIFDTTNAEHNNFYTEDATSGGGYSNGGRVKFVITDTQVETWRYNSSSDTWTKSMMLYNLPVKIGFAYGTEIISDTAKIPFFASATTGSNGEATFTYESQGIGDVNIKAECMNLQETYELIDAKYYASNETINLAPRFNNDRILFASDYQIQEGDKIHFRFKNITNHMLWGIGSTAGSDFTFEQVGTTLKYWRNVLSNSSYNNPSFLATTESDYIFEYLKYDSTQWKVNIYIGSRYVDYWRCGNSIRKVRIDKYDNSDPSWNVEVFVL